jgi:hypothetical protein
MIGAICKRDILTHPFVTVHCFGWQVFFKALIAKGDQTFLSLLVQTNALQPPTVRVPELVGRCVRLELRAKAIFEVLARQFSDQSSVANFLKTLAQQEQSHAELLDLCRELASRVRWLEAEFAPWRDAVPRIEQQLADVESSLKSLGSVADALRLVIQIEGSEVNHIFRGIVAASDSEFVRKLDAFQTAGEKHITYICNEIPKLEPQLADECQDLKDRYFSATNK